MDTQDNAKARPRPRMRAVAALGISASLLGLTSCLVKVTDGNDSSDYPTLSADGRYLAFRSSASNLVPGDTNGQDDIFVWDRSGSTISRITNSSTTPYNPVISSDGNYVAFDAGNIFVWDRATATTNRVTNGNATSLSPAISADGRFVTYHSFASDLVAGDNNGAADIFMWDRLTATTTRLTNGNAESTSAAISDDGRYVAFWSAATNLVAGDTNGKGDVFVRDRTSGATVRITDGGYGYGGLPMAIDLSTDGRYVAYAISSSTFGGGTYPLLDVFTWDRVTGVTTRVTAGNNNSGLSGLAISGDGRFITLASSATDLPGDATSSGGIFTWDRTTANLKRVDAGGSPDISADGKYLAFLRDGSVYTGDNSN